jgi:Rps23 Pro-64 3,4-dihydroxylase Tpa1-like proline 4-hydroxylase
MGSAGTWHANLACSETFEKTTAMLNYEALADRFGALAHQYATAAPFPHVILHDLFPADVLRQAAAEFASPEDMEEQYSDDAQMKSAESRWEKFGPVTRSLMAELNSGGFVRALERLTGIRHLVVDAELFGAGQHQIGPGGLLKVHADFNKHVRTGLDRRLNALLYLNDPWDEAWGGHFELWDSKMTQAVVRVPPSLGTFVVFSTTATSFHGHPDPLQCPPGTSRKSLALYYYSSPISIDGFRTTDFRARPGERIRFKPPLSRREQLRRWVPPAVLDIRRSLQRH